MASASEFYKSRRKRVETMGASPTFDGIGQLPSQPDQPTNGNKWQMRLSVDGNQVSMMSWVFLLRRDPKCLQLVTKVHDILLKHGLSPMPSDTAHMALLSSARAYSTSSAAYVDPYVEIRSNNVVRRVSQKEINDAVIQICRTTKPPTVRFTGRVGVLPNAQRPRRPFSRPGSKRR